MKVSIIMVTLNAEDVVREALQSVDMQNHCDLELVVVDGGSTDGTLRHVSRCNQRELKVLSGPDEGIYDAMNKGLTAASGEALFFLNADDRLAQPSSIADMASLLVSDGADIAMGDILVVGKGGDRLRSHRAVEVKRLAYESLSHQAVLSRRTAFDTVGTFDTRWRICADLDWFMRCGEAGLRFAYLPRLVCRCLTGGVSQRLHHLQRSEVEQIAALYRRRHRRIVQRVAAGIRRRARRLLFPTLCGNDREGD